MKQKNIGLVGNHNRCLELADGKYVCFLIHDDIMLPENFALKVSILDENPNVGLVHSYVLFIDKNGEHRVSLNLRQKEIISKMG